MGTEVSVVYEPSVIVGERYRIDKLLAGGAYALVYLAHHIHLGAPRALKVSRTTEPATHRDLFREAELLALLNCPGVARVYDAGLLSDRRAYMAAEWIPGEHLARILRRKRPTAQQSVQLCCSVASILSGVHERGVLHRDVKPKNIMVGLVEGAPDYSRITLIDFGIYLPLDVLSPAGPRATHSGKFSGTPVYMAPEQLTGRRQTVATDVYGVAAVLHELLFGYAPMCKEQATTRFVLPAIGDDFHLNIVCDRLTKEVVLPDVPPIPSDLRSLLQSALHTNPECRPHSARELADRLCAVDRRWISDPDVTSAHNGTNC